METFAPGTLVVVAGRLGTVQRADRHAGADGYRIHEGGAYARFASAWQVHRAEIGRNVCDKPREGGAWCCPLIHLDADTLARVRAQS